jgi:hypothetical protein
MRTCGTRGKNRGKGKDEQHRRECSRFIADLLVAIKSVADQGDEMYSYALSIDTKLGVTLVVESKVV